MIYLLGGAGWPNFGDELIVRYWLEALKARGRHDVSLDGANVRTLKALFTKTSPGTTFTNLFCGLRTKAPGEFWAAVKFGLDFFTAGGLSRYPELGRSDSELDPVDVVHLHGGGYLNKHWGNNGFLLGVAVALKRRNGCRLIGTGLGIGPLTPPEPELADIVGAAFDEFELIECRDATSYEIVRSVSRTAHAILGLDDVFIKGVRLTKADRPNLHVSIFKSAADDPNDVDAFTRIWQAGDFGQVYLWCCSNGDRATLERFTASVTSKCEIQVKALIHDDLPVSIGDVMVTSRFHPHLMAARMGATGHYIIRGSYYEAKHGSVVALGSPFAPIGETLRMGKRSWIAELDAQRVALKNKMIDAAYGDESAGKIGPKSSWLDKLLPRCGG